MIHTRNQINSCIIYPGMRAKYNQNMIDNGLVFDFDYTSKSSDSDTNSEESDDLNLEFSLSENSEDSDEDDLTQTIQQFKTNSDIETKVCQTISASNFPEFKQNKQQNILPIRTIPLPNSRMNKK